MNHYRFAAMRPTGPSGKRAERQMVPSAGQAARGLRQTANSIAAQNPL
jgi:hypothetical protein